MTLHHPALLLATLAAGLLGLIPGAATECPTDCVCMWKNGKETIECINRDRDAIPPGIEPSTQVLDLRGNNIRVLRNDVFLNMGITNLQKIFCSYCKISEVEPKAFRRLTNLVELDLSENSMREIPSEAWKNSKALMRLNLSGNPIKLIRSGAFQKLQFVTNLALSHCEIETLEVGAFDGMDSLVELKLESNKLNYLQGSGLFPKSLHHLQIHDNPFRCDCRLLDFAHWTQTSGIPRGVEPSCHSPQRLQNRTLASLDLHELACLPQVSPSSTPPASNSLRLSLSSPSSDFSVKEAPAVRGGSGGGRELSPLREDPTTTILDDVSIVETVSGRNVSLRCTVFGIPSASVSWWHDNRLVSNGSKLEHAWEDQYYAIAEYRTNAHQLVSEFVILFVRLQDDDGAFYCAAQNPAGVARANFSIRVIESVGAGPGDNQSNSDNGSKNQNQSESDLNMFKVEYILGFGAAAVIVLTIIIVLILYIILQCRSRRRKHRAALRAAGLPCDSNSGSYMERSTIDFIVPGEMELTSAVRSVSCNNANSLNSKCLTNNSNSNSMAHAGGSLGRNTSTKLSNCKDDGSGHEGDDEDEYGGGHGMTKTASTSLASSSAGSLHKSGGFHITPMQQPPQQIDGVYPRQYPLVNGYLAGGCNSWQPPSYRHPPPPPHLQAPNFGYNKGSICHCCGEFQMPPQFFSPMVPYQHRPMYTANFISGGLHFKNCPRAGNVTIPEKRLSYGDGDPEHFRLSSGSNQHDPYLMGNPSSHHAYPMVQRSIPVHQHQQQQQQPFHNNQMFQSRPDWAPVGILRNGGGRNFAQSVNRNQFIVPQTPNSDQEETRYGPFSDGEADRVSKKPGVGPTVGSIRGGRGRIRRQSTSSYCGSLNVDVPPHYVTLSRTMSRIGYHQQYDQQFQSMVEPCQVRYNSQPHLNRNSGSHIVRQPSKESLSKPALPAKPVKFVVPKPMPSYQKPVSQQLNRHPDDEYLFPDLPPPPDALLDPPPSEQAFFQIATNGHSASSFQNSRSSSLDDLQWVTSAADLSRADQSDAFNHKSNTLPSEGKESRGRSPNSRQNGTSSQCSKNRQGSGAVRVDLSSADKTIRRPGSAPELAVKRPGSPVRSALRRQQQNNSEISEPKKMNLNTPLHHANSRIGGPSEGTSCNKRVMFSGVSDGDSPSESQDDVWVLREDPATSAEALIQEEEPVPVTGVVVARPQLMCRPMPAPQYVLARVETHPNPLMSGSNPIHSLNSPSLSGPIPIATSATSPRRMAVLQPQPMLPPCSNTIVPVRPPPPPPPPRTTPTAGPVRPVNPVLQRPSLQPRGNFHESPDEGYHEDDAGSEVL